MHQTMLAFGMFMVSGITATVAADDTHRPFPELAALEDLIGTWDEVMTNKATEWTPTAGESTSVTKRAWSLGGKFIRAEGTWQPAKTKFLQLMSYDPNAKVYRSWYFDDAGTMPRGSAKGAWDEKTRTLSWRDTDESGNKTVSQHKIIDKDHSEWTMVATNPEGKVVLDLTGRCSRRKE